ncbi:hypothetical protein C2869_03000 [Saccharobesus litoralis]|uniref:Uncharacterized protein n=1 Tax=Saccharobesus litoralis TaxID=2172099 RepID=A0A2S0VMP7_9ALTE|nr:hypothetical protein C2869_03000 [Saccharobesus litoralis]
MAIGIQPNLIDNTFIYFAHLKEAENDHLVSFKISEFNTNKNVTCFVSNSGLTTNIKLVG